MAEERTDRHALPLLQAGQAQKELTHNEALVMLDLLAMAAATGIAEVPPAAPSPGDCWIVGPAAGGPWAGAANMLAGWTESGWRFAAPTPGMRVWLTSDDCEAAWRDGAWVVGETRTRRLVIGGEQVAGPRQPAIAAPSGGATVDVEARASLTAILAALTAHGLVATD
ncbi:hypothetical protein COC42_10755 [Sphingomonas spermidinifaciens]|uniref:DUF2793 domain-containing protein n=1 Tax=Sphingomonas spermidinifaciens TaxID=1141889 RepID=A0A2A4B1M3_9SPHN|nr:DUF2793 domain-containing protein [Sphingomonas spermidinifaciens]PCD01970.1 hypothetical protein COC42_10755 [Sphingomonas spermidinifaciens]